MNTRPYITCRQLLEIIASFVDEDLDEAEHADFERHLERCPSCRAYLASYLQVMDLTKLVIYDDDVAEGVPEDLVRIVLGRRR